MRGPPGWWWLVVHPTGEGIACQARHGVDACSTNSLPRKRLRKPLLLSLLLGEGGRRPDEGQGHGGPPQLPRTSSTLIRPDGHPLPGGEGTERRPISITYAQ